jgi:porin-like protein
MAQRAIVLSTLSLAACLSAECLTATSAQAGDAPVAQNDTRCRAQGEGFIAAPGSDVCVRFSGYVAAGAEYEPQSRPNAAPGPLQAPLPPVMQTNVGASLDARTDTAMGPLRAYIQVGRSPPGANP